ncbi:MAG: hypothetical protein ACRENK_15710 [Gemmatimonadaceae bacterium]
MDSDGDGPPRTKEGKYSASEFGEWLKKRNTGGDKERLLKAQADVAEMEAAELAGELIRKSKAAEYYGKKVITTRARFMVLPPTAAPLIAPAGKIAEAQAILQKLVYEALNELADG